MSRRVRADDLVPPRPPLAYTNYPPPRVEEKDFGSISADHISGGTISGVTITATEFAAATANFYGSIFANALGSGAQTIVEAGPNGLIIKSPFSDRGRVYRNGADVSFTVYDTTPTEQEMLRFLSTATPYARFYAPGGVVIGGAGGLAGQGLGTLTVEADIYKDVAGFATAYANPDYVFELKYLGKAKSPTPRRYRLRSLKETERYCRKHLHLPGISRKKSGAFERADMALEKIEEAHLHLFDVNARITALERADLSTRIAALERRVKQHTTRR